MTPHIYIRNFSELAHEITKYAQYIIPMLDDEDWKVRRKAVEVLC